MFLVLASVPLLSVDGRPDWAVRNGGVPVTILVGDRCLLMMRDGSCCQHDFTWLKRIDLPVISIPSLTDGERCSFDSVTTNALTVLNDSVQHIPAIDL